MVRYGIDLAPGKPEIFRGKRLGLLTSVSGANSQLESSISVLHEAFGLCALFGPEHGVRGNRDAGMPVDSNQDAETGLPVFSLYRKESKRFTEEMLQGVDAVIYDIQDLGTRFYTFVTSLFYTLQDCANYKKELILLDRPNPLGGTIVEGNILKEEYMSFVGGYPMPIRYGLTAGEFALMANAEMKIGCRLTVLPVEGWKRQELFSDIGNLWMMPSLGIPRFDSALFYPGTCLIEGTNVSEGRGTSCPFELIGAPYIHGERLAQAMNLKHLPGVIFTPAWFTPTASKHAGTACGGVHLHLTNRSSYRAVETGVELLFTIREMYEKEFAFLPPYKEETRPFITLLAGCADFISPDADKKKILQGFIKDSEKFKTCSAKYHLYE